MAAALDLPRRREQCYARGHAQSFIAGARRAARLSPAFADTLIDNANGIQVGPDGKLQRFTGLLVGDDGKVVSVLHAERMRAARPGAHRRAGAGRLLPGLIDAHGHVHGPRLRRAAARPHGTSSLADLQQRLRDYAAAHPETRWILGRGWNQELWPDKRFPTAADLDAVVRTGRSCSSASTATRSSRTAPR